MSRTHFLEQQALSMLPTYTTLTWRSHLTLNATDAWCYYSYCTDEKTEAQKSQGQTASKVEGWRLDPRPDASKAPCSFLPGKASPLLLWTWVSPTESHSRKSFIHLFFLPPSHHSYSLESNRLESGSCLCHFLVTFEPWEWCCMFWVEFFPPTPPQNSHVEVLSLSISNSTLFGHRVFTEVIALKWGH